MILSWIFMILCGIFAIYPATQLSTGSVVGTSLCILAVAANAFVIGRRS